MSAANAVRLDIFPYLEPPWLRSVVFISIFAIVFGALNYFVIYAVVKVIPQLLGAQLS
jgi:hypothetical protein